MRLRPFPHRYSVLTLFPHSNTILLSSHHSTSFAPLFNSNTTLKFAHRSSVLDLLSSFRTTLLASHRSPHSHTALRARFALLFLRFDQSGRGNPATTHSLVPDSHFRSRPTILFSRCSLIISLPFTDSVRWQVTLLVNLIRLPLITAIIYYQQNTPILQAFF